MEKLNDTIIASLLGDSKAKAHTTALTQAMTDALYGAGGLDELRAAQETVWSSVTDKMRAVAKDALRLAPGNAEAAFVALMDQVEVDIRGKSASLKDSLGHAASGWKVTKSRFRAALREGVSVSLPQADMVAHTTSAKAARTGSPAPRARARAKAGTCAVEAREQLADMLEALNGLGPEHADHARAILAEATTRLQALVVPEAGGSVDPEAMRKQA